MGFPICNRSFLEHTTMPPRGVSWPPADSAAFIRTDVFANLMISIITDLAEKYPHMDFADAAASLFTWLDRKVATEPGFISIERFPRPSAFRAYLRAGAWNVARLTARQRKREAQISELGPNFEPVSREAGPEIIAMIQECKDKLPVRQRRIYELFVQEEIPEAFHCNRLPYVTSIIQGEQEELTERDVLKHYDEACTAIIACINGKDGGRRKRSTRRKR